MKKLFYIGIVCFALFEIANVYFIMPMPGGSQEINSIDMAYTLHSWRWVFRGFFTLLIILGSRPVFSGKKWLPVAALILLSGIIYMTNYYIAADAMFYQPTALSVKDVSKNSVEKDRLIIGITYKGQAKAYPIQYLGYHHQVRDSIGGKPIMVTYCTVCRTGRVFEPIVNGKTEEFRLVGMDHFNAMFEDKTTKSWWRQATGEAITGSLKGQQLPEFPAMQTTLSKWVELYPHSLVMQPDPHFQVEYDSMRTYEKGRLTGKLTRRDTASWQNKSWVVGVEIGNASKAYDWNLLQKEHIIYDVIDSTPIAVVLSKDSSSFVVLERINQEQLFVLANDTLRSRENAYNFAGISLNEPGNDLKRINAYQEYWHSWQTFHPMTQKHKRN
ncbi:MAG: DUF3179 domain-containing protein [Phaeodactylibacter sp.]|nr:DUF3179 domain-containing protein [Phaeodactylibacter sp.]MCB9277112.1 DUF3179 domain-containing protein [Lewinellaceae bacterium]